MAEGCEDSAGAAESTTSQSQYTTLDKMLGTVLPCEAAIGATPGGSGSSSSSSNTGNTSNNGSNIVKREFCDGSLMPGAGEIILKVKRSLHNSSLHRTFLRVFKVMHL